LTLLERRLVFRFLGISARILAVLLCLVVCLHVPRTVSQEGLALSPASALRLAVRVLQAFEVAVIFAAPLGIFLVLDALGRRGVLVPLLAAPHGLRRLRRGLIATAVLTAVAAGGLFELSFALTDARRGPDDVRLWRAGAVRAWQPVFEDGTVLDRLVLFKETGLDVSLAPVPGAGPENGTFIVTGARPVVGASFPEPLAFAQHAKATWNMLPPPSWWWRGTTPLGLRLAAFNRTLLPGVLVILLAYVVLILPRARRALALAVYLLILPAVGFGTSWCSIALWRNETYALVAELVWWVLLLAVFVGLDRLFYRRGLRIA
jgi:hypothetical protein